MSLAAIIVRTANRPEILDRCITAAVDGCSIARESHWIVLDDSSLGNQIFNCDIAQFWKRSGLRLTYVNKAVEEEIANAIPNRTFRSYFTQLAARPSSCRSEGGRNLGLILGLALNPDVLFFVDDDMVHRHEGNCFFHWCANIQGGDSFVATPREMGISDMTYLRRLTAALKHDHWAQFVSDTGISADSGSWYSPTNPLWENQNDRSGQTANTLKKRDTVRGQLMALRNNGVEWLPFPSEYNSDLNWSFLQSSVHRTALLEVSEGNAQHLPPSIRHPEAEAILSEIVGVAITQALQQTKPHDARLLDTLAKSLPSILGDEIKKELFLFLEVERAIRFRLQGCTEDARASRALSNIQSILAEVTELLKSLESHRLAREWLDDIAVRRKMFTELRRSGTVQMQIRHVLDANV